MGVFRDKEYEKIVKLMAPFAKTVYTVDLPDKERTLPKEKLAEVLRKYCEEDTKIETAESVKIALNEILEEAKKDDIVLAFGSLSYLGSVMEELDKR
jgi:dihydrofolate synthase/folylpolyglutamate synthase